MGLKVSCSAQGTKLPQFTIDTDDIVRQFLGAKAAAALDKELMSSGAFSIDQLMELAGLSVSQAGAH